MLWQSRGPAEQAVPWPQEWPGLNSDRAIRRHDNQASIYLDIALEREVIKLGDSLKTRRSGVLLDGKVWAFSVRPVFPGEPIWRAVIYPGRPAPR